MLFVLGINNSWFQSCLHGGVPFRGKRWCFWSRNGRERSLSPCIFAQHWVSRGVSFCRCCLLVCFKRTRAEGWENSTQNRIHRHQALGGTGRRSNKEAGSRTCCEGSAEGGRAFSMLTEYQGCKWDYKAVTTVVAVVPGTPVPPVLEAG